MPEENPGPNEAAPRALETRDLTVHLGRRLVLDQVTLAAEHGAVTALLGPNGAGKTTLLRALLGLVPGSGPGRAARGEILIDGRPLAALSRRERARTIAYLPQRSALDAPLAVATVVAHGRYAHVGSGSLGLDDRQAIEQALAACDVSALTARPFTALSGGEQRRVLLARALATGARILVLDEPAASLDIGHCLALYDLFGRLARAGYCVVIAMHDLADALDHADAAVLLDRGRVAASGATRDVLAAEPIRRVYGVELGHATRPVFRLPDPGAGAGAGGIRATGAASTTGELDP